MKLNKAETTARNMALAGSNIRNCTKLQIDNIIFPKWSSMGLLKMVFSQKIKTKEQPQGCDYDEATYQVVMRVINGKVLMTGGRPDAYTWKQSKVDKLISEPGNIHPIGVNSAEAIINLSKMLSTIPDEDEQTLFADMFCRFRNDFLLITTGTESRRCIEITSELYDADLTTNVDTWMEPDENGEAEATQLNVGDYLIVEGDCLYCIRGEEFKETHSIDN